VKAIAIFSKNRLAVLPELASAHEQGVGDFEVAPWYAFFLPKGTPSPIVRKLNDAAAATMETPAVQEKLKAFGYIRRSRPPIARILRKFVDAGASLAGLAVANIHDSRLSTNRRT
jgi:tripartite-type tricarboxylate transporter receptor subunit TctC